MDDVVAEQIAYYRARAAEYDRTIPGAVGVAERIAAVLDRIRPRGTAIELACGTGLWTRDLATRVRDLEAIDSAPEAIALARARCPRSVRFTVADVFGWRPSRRVDLVFFGFFLSHVPADRFDGFFATIADALVPDGRVVFVDEHAGSGSYPERWLGDETVERALDDGSRHRLFKVFHDPDALRERLTTLGWHAEITLDDPWMIGDLRPR